MQHNNFSLGKKKLKTECSSGDYKSTKLINEAMGGCPCAICKNSLVTSVNNVWLQTLCVLGVRHKMETKVISIAALQKLDDDVTISTFIVATIALLKSTILCTQFQNDSCQPEKNNKIHCLSFFFY